MEYIKKTPHKIMNMPAVKLAIGGESVDDILIYDEDVIPQLDPQFDYKFDVRRNAYDDEYEYRLIKHNKTFWIKNPDYDKQLMEYEKYENEYAIYSEEVDKHNAEVKRLKTEASERIEFERLKAKFGK